MFALFIDLSGSTIYFKRSPQEHSWQPNLAPTSVRSRSFHFDGLRDALHNIGETSIWNTSFIKYQVYEIKDY